MTTQSVYWNPQSNYNGFHIVQSGQVQLRNIFLIRRSIGYLIGQFENRS